MIEVSEVQHKAQVVLAPVVCKSKFHAKIWVSRRGGFTSDSD